MGRFKHTAAIFTSGQEPPTRLQYLHAQAIIFYEESEEFGKEANSIITPIMAAPRNGYHSFVILPDCSKEGWPASNKADEIRTAICNLAEIEGVDYIMVMYGGDDDYSVIMKSRQ